MTTSDKTPGFTVEELSDAETAAAWDSLRLTYRPWAGLIRRVGADRAARRITAHDPIQAKAIANGLRHANAYLGLGHTVRVVQRGSHVLLIPTLPGSEGR